MNHGPITYGTLALKTDPQLDPVFTVISGGASGAFATLVRHPQVAAPDVYARSHSRAAPLSRTLALGTALILLLCALVAVAFTYGQIRSVRQRALIDALGSQVVVVGTGESLWDIAQTHPVDNLPTTESVELIRNWNALSTSTIQPGTELIIPAALP